MWFCCSTWCCTYLASRGFDRLRLGRRIVLALSLPWPQLGLQIRCCLFVLLGLFGGFFRHLYWGLSSWDPCFFCILCLLHSWSIFFQVPEYFRDLNARMPSLPPSVPERHANMLLHCPSMKRRPWSHSTRKQQILSGTIAFTYDFKFFSHWDSYTKYQLKPHRKI